MGEIFGLGFGHSAETAPTYNHQSGVSSFRVTIRPVFVSLITSTFPAFSGISWVINSRQAPQ